MFSNKKNFFNFESHDCKSSLNSVTFVLLYLFTQMLIEYQKDECELQIHLFKWHTCILMGDISFTFRVIFVSWNFFYNNIGVLLINNKSSNFTDHFTLLHNKFYFMKT